MTPRIVARASYLGQTGTVGQTTLYTSPFGGVYRVSICSTNNDNDIPGLNIWFTDENGVHEISGIAWSIDSYNNDRMQSVVITVPSVQGGDIQFSGGFGGSTFNFYFVIEEL